VGSLNNVPSQVRTTVVPEVPIARRWDVRRFWAVLINFGRFQRRYAPKTHLDSRFQAKSTRSEPLYSKKLEGSVVCTVRSGLTTDTRPTAFVAFPSYETLNCKSV